MKNIFVRLKAYFLNRKLKWQSMSDLKKLYLVLRSIDSTLFMISLFLMALAGLAIYVVCRLYEVGII